MKRTAHVSRREVVVGTAALATALIGTRATAQTPPRGNPIMGRAGDAWPALVDDAL